MTFRTAFLPICLLAALAGLWFIQREGIASGISRFVAEGQAKTETAPAPGTVDLTPEALRQAFVESAQRLRAGHQFSVLKPDARIEQWLSVGRRVAPQGVAKAAPGVLQRKGNEVDGTLSS